MMMRHEMTLYELVQQGNRIAASRQLGQKESLIQDRLVTTSGITKSYVILSYFHL